MKPIILIPLAALLVTGCSQGENEAETQAAQPASEAPAAEHAGPAGASARAHGEGQGSMEMRLMTPAPGDTPATRSYKASMSTMMKSMPAYTQDADVDFNQQMKVHH